MTGRKAIPPKVKQLLRQEVGFGCPVRGCGNPYLEYHHFDPPVNIRPHNDPEGMIALCAQHHKKADGGAYTVEQLHALKKDKANAAHVKGNLDWLRRDLLAVVGGNFYYETPRIIEVDGIEVVSLHRDEDGYLRLSVNMLSLLPQERIIIESNSWERIGNPLDLRSPPQGKELEVMYSNGDCLHLRFIELDSLESAIKRYSTDIFKSLSFPITAVEVNFSVAGTNINLTPTSTTLGGLQMTGSMMSRCGTGVCLRTGTKWLQNSKVQTKSADRVVDVSDNVLRVDFRRS
ncbi:HNH endonuclease [Vibrio albus]|uniref:HNH endonuclease n=1 Tax=Vibrio albus TaxID=2200953 RepID=A0A2U3BD12_9VIBR|nr:HNH endonuclease [Vibrio albus]PWI34670.1 HNH endonuclease [Vibrio albus]